MLLPRRCRLKSLRCLLLGGASGAAIISMVSFAHTAWITVQRQTRRQALNLQFIPGLVATATMIEYQSPVLAEVVYRTKRESPEIPKVLAVMLMRTTYDAVEDWGCYSDMSTYQRDFFLQLQSGKQSFLERFQNYNLGIYNDTYLQETQSGGITNQFYFSFLNDAQWRVIGQAITRRTAREQFSRVVGTRLYQSILAGEVLKADVAPEDAVVVNTSIGTWPALAESLPTGIDPTSLKRGVNLLLGYLVTQSYCKSFEVSEVTQDSKGTLEFVSYVGDPVNLQATLSLMRSNDDFAPRYDQRILQAYFESRGLESRFSDALANGLDLLDGKNKRVPVNRVPSGVCTKWTLRRDPDADASL